LREVFADTEKSQDVDMQSFHIDVPIQQTEQSSIDFSDTTSVAFKEDEQLHYWRQFLRLMTISVVSILLGLLVYASYRYTNQLSQPQITQSMSPYLSTIHDTYKNIVGYLG